MALLGDRWVESVRDEGPGIPAERLAEYALVRGGALEGAWPTYRGEGRTFS